MLDLTMHACVKCLIIRFDGYFPVGVPTPFPSPPPLERKEKQRRNRELHWQLENKDKTTKM